jgi:hypothetical protein
MPSYQLFRNFARDWITFLHKNTLEIWIGLPCFSRISKRFERFPQKNFLFSSQTAQFLAFLSFVAYSIHGRIVITLQSRLYPPLQSNGCAMGDTQLRTKMM